MADDVNNEHQRTMDHQLEREAAWHMLPATPAVRRPVWLRREGDHAVILVEVSGKWIEVIREHFDGAFSHIWEDNS